MLGYYILRPVREGFGVEREKEVLKFLYLGTFLGTLIAIPLYGRLVSSMPRQKFIPYVFRFFSLNLILFSVCIHWANSSPWPGRVFYCWLSVYSVFTVSVIWSFLVDVFAPIHARRMFGPIAVGMSIGGIAGSLVTDVFVEILGLPGLLLLPIGIAEIVLLGLRRVEALSQKLNQREQGGMDQSQESISGGLVDGIRVVLKSDYLRHICLLLFCAAGASTIFYFAQNNFVRASFIDDTPGKTRFFARMNLATQIFTIALQAFAVSRIVKRWGLGTALMVLPIVAIIGLLILGFQGGLAALVPCYILMKSTHRGIASPTKQMLFAVVNRQQKYKSKNFIDTVVLRGSDVAIMWILSAMQVQLHMDVESIVLSSIPLAILWIITAKRLGQLHNQHNRSETQELSVR